MSDPENLIWVGSLYLHIESEVEM